jgi:hypothetical protein
MSTGQGLSLSCLNHFEGAAILLEINSSPTSTLHRNYLKSNDDSAHCCTVLSSNNRANLTLLTMPYHHNNRDTHTTLTTNVDVDVTTPLHSLPREAHTLNLFADRTTTTLLRRRRGSNQIMSALHCMHSADRKGRKSLENEETQTQRERLEEPLCEEWRS